ncbi:MAG: class I SAM-dependent methyltransferase [Bacteroidetes bacterium]|nr:class I SAM-dependent methyltransferase [Bacteroidota bacterium]
MLRKIYYKLTPGMRMLARKVYYLPVDFYEKMIVKTNTNTPSKGDIYVGSGDFVLQGKHQLHLLQKHIDLQPKDKVLDVGCGIGRTAMALTEFLSSEGTYHGFDVVEKGISWCNKNIHSQYPNFQFQFVPLRNSLYNSYTRESKEFQFPYADCSFSKVYLFSVFTHMTIEDIQQYLNEIYRVLETDGYCLATFFIYKKEEDLNKNEGFKFEYEKNGYRLLNNSLEEANIAIEEEKLHAMIEQSGLKNVNFIKGFWSNFRLKSIDNDFQDIVILKK